tara:strand:+ start:3113 stop:4324 length:1212 start_codon:yes stop_codon:yes gene_type:complete
VKVAVCIYGNVGDIKRSRDTSCEESLADLSAKISYAHFKKHVIDANPDIDFDIFIHCWNKNLEEEIVSMYKPTLYLFENNKKFYEYKEYEYKEVIKKDREQYLLSRQKSIDLCFNYDKDNSYDFIISTRFDIAYKKNLDLSFLKKGHLYIPLYNVFSRNPSGGWLKAADPALGSPSLLRNRLICDYLIIGEKNSIDFFHKEIYRLARDLFHFEYIHKFFAVGLAATLEEFGFKLLLIPDHYADHSLKNHNTMPLVRTQYFTEHYGNVVTGRIKDCESLCKDRDFEVAQSSFLLPNGSQDRPKFVYKVKKIMGIKAKKRKVKDEKKLYKKLAKRDRKKKEIEKIKKLKQSSKRESLRIKKSQKEKRPEVISMKIKKRISTSKTVLSQRSSHFNSGISIKPRKKD